MTRREWETFFELLEKIVNMEGKTATEKGEEVRAHAREEGEAAESNLSEFMAWDLDA